MDKMGPEKKCEFCTNGIQVVRRINPNDRSGDLIIENVPCGICSPPRKYGKKE